MSAELTPEEAVRKFFDCYTNGRPEDFGECVAPAIRKSSIFFPVLIAAANHRGFNPRPAHVSPGF